MQVRSTFSRQWCDAVEHFVFDPYLEKFVSLPVAQVVGQLFSDDVAGCTFLARVECSLLEVSCFLSTGFATHSQCEVRFPKNERLGR